MKNYEIMIAVFMCVQILLDWSFVAWMLQQQKTTEWVVKTLKRLTEVLANYHWK